MIHACPYFPSPMRQAIGVTESPSLGLSSFRDVRLTALGVTTRLKGSERYLSPRESSSNSLRKRIAFDHGNSYSESSAAVRIASGHSIATHKNERGCCSSPSQESPPRAVVGKHGAFNTHCIAADVSSASRICMSQQLAVLRIKYNLFAQQTVAQVSLLANDAPVDHPPFWSPPAHPFGRKNEASCVQLERPGSRLI